MGSTPTRPISNCGLVIAECGFTNTPQSAIKNAREAQMAECAIGNREEASSILAAGLEVKIMAKILPIIIANWRERYITGRKRALVRKLTLIRRCRRGSIAQTAERRSHKSVAGGSTPPRATIVDVEALWGGQAGKAPDC